MICARQNLGMPDNCAICKALQPEFYSPCRGEPDKVKPPTKRPQPEISEPINNLSHNSKNKKIRELSYEEAKKEVEKYIQTQNGKIHISEISENLRIDIEMVEKIVEELWNQHL